MSEQGFNPEEFVLEANVLGGGCSGFTHKLGFKERSKVDATRETVFNIEGVDIAVNHRSMLYLNGTTIDFHESLNKRGFSFENPNSKGTCGCGSSFSI
jgi:iron-sulfur cluster assembly accessory protein